MVKQEDFAVEQFMDKYETNIEYNMAETCVDSLSFNELLELSQDNSNRKTLTDKILNAKLTYGHIRGSPELKNAIAKIYNADNNDDHITGEDIVITNGAIGANFLTLYSLVDNNDKVIVVNPTYQQLSSVSQAFSGNKDNIISWDLKFENQYLPNLEELEELVAKHSPKLLIINNPNNPTGVVWGDDIMRKIVTICSTNDIYLLCDEVYRPLYHSTENVPNSVVNYGYDKTISTSSTSKAFSLAGLRLGWIVTKDSNVINGLYSKRDYNTISVSMIDDLLAIVALENYQVIIKRSYDICTTNLQVLQNYIDNSELLSWVKPKGGSTCFIKVNVEGIDTMKMCEELANEFKTLIVPGEVFGNRKGYLRVGFGNSTENIKQGLEQLTKYFKMKGYN
ncbi:Capreomycidine synthase [Spathaspora sp. JA1]|nr:Capreomycidine synthase [Spathaspora sp. JA1]